MSFLYPLFLAGITAIGLPILLHMVRRHTRHRVTFSSLMFLRSTLPRLRNRSRVEHLLLLILRCLVVCLLAFAFARPFFNRAIADDPARPGLGRRVVLLVDTSASMRRAGMWAQAIREVRSVLEEAGPMDRVCVMAFDRDTRRVSGFDQWETLELTQRASVTLEQISRLSPSWAATRLGEALVAAAEVLEDDEVNEGQRPIGPRQVVLISDLQQGSRLDTLQGYEWPKGTELVVRQVECAGTTNASLQWVTGFRDLAAPGADRPAVRVTNSPDATRERFLLHWADDGSGSEPNQSLEVYVPPGRSVVVQAPARMNRSDTGRLVLTGDDQDFDNTLYWAPALRQAVNILYVGPDDPNDPKDMLYYLRRAFGSMDPQSSHVVWQSGTWRPIPAEEIESAHLIVVTGTVDPQYSPALRRYVESGHTALLVTRSAEAVTTLAALAGIAAPRCEEATADQDTASQSGRGYAMLGRTDLRHPLLVPFSDPQYGDFTRIHFWRHRRLDPGDCPGARVLAWFDSNDPALFEMGVGKGTLLVLTSGWNPSDSDLALSSKFVPLLYSVLDQAGALAGQQSQYCVGDSVPVQPMAGSTTLAVQVRRPDGSSVPVDVGQPFGQTELPGIYTIQSPANDRFFAVNLQAEEGRTAPMPVEDLESLGVMLRSSSDVPVVATAHAGQMDSPVAREGDQKVWRWVLGAALAVLLMEIGLAGRPIRQTPDRQGGQL